MKIMVYSLAIIAIQVCGLGKELNATYDNYKVLVRASVLTQEHMLGIIGAYEDSYDVYDKYDMLLQDGEDIRANLATYHVNGVNGWDGPTGFYQRDYRSPMSRDIGSYTTWRLYVWAGPEVPEPQTFIRMKVDYGGGVIPWDSNLAVTLALIAKPEGIEDGPDVGTVWQTKPLSNLIGYFPIYRTDNGLEGYVFDLTVTVIPEPASILVLSAGLAGFAGAVRRRRGD